MPTSRRQRTGKQQRMSLTLPADLAADIQRYAALLHEGDANAFVADALASYIDHLNRARHTAKLRDSYAASATASLAITRQWEPLDAEAWAQLDTEKPHRKDR
jgi:hypothetical protein